MHPQLRAKVREEEVDMLLGDVARHREGRVEVVQALDCFLLEAVSLSKKACSRLQAAEWGLPRFAEQEQGFPLRADQKRVDVAGNAHRGEGEERPEEGKESTTRRVATASHHPRR